MFILLSNHPETLFVLPAGNYNTGVPSVSTLDKVQSSLCFELPGCINLPNTITVGAFDPFLLPSNPLYRARWGGTEASDYGPAVEIAAPGSHVYAPQPFPAVAYTNPINSIRFNGTSPAAAFATGAAGILKALEGITPSKSLSPQQIKNILISSADPIATDKPIGPRLNILRAVRHAISGPQFDFAVDFLSVAGNVPPFFDDFNGNSANSPFDPNITCASRVSESSGFLHLNSADGADASSPSFLIDNCALGLNAPVFRLNDGSRNSVITASFRADVPGPS